MFSTEEIAGLYHYVYIIIVALFSVSVIQSYKLTDGSDEYRYPANRIGELLAVIILIALIGVRPVSARYFVDMAAYQQEYYHMAEGFYEFSWNTDNKIFDNLFSAWAALNLGATNFFMFISAIYFGCSYIGIKKLFPDHTLPAYLVFLAAFSTFSYATNGIKAGAAASIFIMALGYMDNKWLCFLFALISLGFHHAMQLPVAALILVMLFENPKWYFYGWLACFFMALLHVTYFQNLFGSITDEQGAGYLLVSETHDTRIGFRPDFILYSAIPVWIGYQFEIKMEQTSLVYSRILHFYICTNAIWMLCMYASFSNRIAYLSWFVYPILLIYPYLYVDKRELRYFYFSKAVKYHLFFTLFMVFIYYGLFSLGT